MSYQNYHKMALVAAAKAAAAGLVAYGGYAFLDDRLQLSHDLALLAKLRPMGAAMSRVRGGALTVVDVWEETVAKFGGREAVVLADDDAPRSFTYAQLDALANRIAHWCAARFRCGDTVALFMENRPEFLATWLGFAKAGVQMAWLNFNIKSKGLLHCIRISEARHVVYGAELADRIGAVARELAAAGVSTSSMGVLGGGGGGGGAVLGGGGGAPHQMDAQIAACPATRPDPALRSDVGTADTLCYIYTSGTTGLPKAVILPHRKVLTVGAFFSTVFATPGVDRNYCCLPLFHSAGGMMGGGMFVFGVTMILKRKFSASAFFPDCQKYKATVAQYIGELCRYLVATPPSPHDTAHSLRLAVGNGLRPEVWDAFQDRFAIPEVLEFYAATEGNGILFNHSTDRASRGAVGRQGFLQKLATGTKIVRFDVENEEPMRDPHTGFCIECAPGEVGEMLTRISDRSPFEGYKNPAATRKKIATNVLAQGDRYFRTGDLLSCDAQGYYYFHDRIGDTFRWKGENCSTTEVAEVVSVFPGVEECNAYGVEIPKGTMTAGAAGAEAGRAAATASDGRAPMCAITPVGGDLAAIDMQGLAEHVRRELPSYAVPLFLRILPHSVSTTATFKHQKVALRQEGIDVTAVPDPVFWLNPETKLYEPFGPPELHLVVTRQARL